MNILVLTEASGGSAETVRDALMQQGHEVHVIEAEPRIENSVRILREVAPDVVFNLCDGRAFQMATLLELLDVAYTGNSAEALTLGRDLLWMRRVLEGDGLPVPPGTVAGKRPSVFSFPLSVRPRFGARNKIVVKNNAALREQVLRICREWGQEAFLEPCIDGREFNVFILGSRVSEVLVIAEANDPEGMPARLTAVLGCAIERAALWAYRALRCCGYARVDLRLDREGHLRVIDVCLNPELSREGWMARAARIRGWSYARLIERIVFLGRGAGDLRTFHRQDRVKGGRRFRECMAIG